MQEKEAYESPAMSVEEDMEEEALGGEGTIIIIPDPPLS